MAKKTASKSTGSTRARTTKPAAKAASKATAATSAKPALAMPTTDFRELSKMAKVLTPEQAFELYRANAKMALEVIDAAIESTAKLRKLQFEGEEEARSMQKKAVRH